MVAKVDIASILLWDEIVGAVAWDDERRFATFEFAPAFLDSGLDPAPLMMPAAEARRGSARFVFPALPQETFKGLPGLLADALPDRFGNSIIDSWLARQGRRPGDFSPVERLCYTGRRAMGALEFVPSTHEALDDAVPVQIADLVELAGAVLAERSHLSGSLAGDPSDALLDIIRVGTSAGGGRPKAVVAFDERTGEVRSGQVDAPAGFSHWILKFDGVEDAVLAAPAGYGRIEYAYHRMAVAAGVEMTDCRLLEENGRAHFMTRRFERHGSHAKLHLQSLCAMAHLDFNAPGRHAYEQAFQVMRELRLPHAAAEQQYRRMVLNIVARNQDDHTKNIAFLMDRQGRWRLSPAFDVTFAYNPAGPWTSQHQMSVNGKRGDFTRDDLLGVGRELSLKQCGEIVDEVVDVVSRWPDFARAAGVEAQRIRAIGATHRLL